MPILCCFLYIYMLWLISMLEYDIKINTFGKKLTTICKVQFTLQEGSLSKLTFIDDNSGEDKKLPYWFHS